MDKPTIYEPKVLLIFAALKCETKAVQSAVDHWTHKSRSIAQHSMYGKITVECIGMRGGRIRQIWPHYAHQRVAGVIMSGVAGALAPELKIGDLVIDSQSSDADRVLEFMMNNMSNRCRVRSGLIHTAKEIVDTVRAKKQMHKETDALAVDMENSYTRQLAERRNVPWLGIRAISDTADESISPHVGHIVDGYGKVRPWNLISSLARKPMLIPQLVRMGKHTSLATKNLSNAIGVVIRSGWPFSGTGGCVAQSSTLVIL